MKKQLFLTTAMAATLSSLSGCSSPEDDWGSEVTADSDTAVCMDEDGYRIDDNACDKDYAVRSSGGRYWYYVNRGNRIPYYGDSVLDPRLGFQGTYFRNEGVKYARAPATANISRSVAVSRGGFGSKARFFGSGRS